MGLLGEGEDSRAHPKEAVKSNGLLLFNNDWQQKTLLSISEGALIN